MVPGVSRRRSVGAAHLLARLSGNAPTIFGGNQDNGNYSIGVAADIFQKYRVDLKYIDYYGKYKDNGIAVTAQNGFTTLLEDRGFISLTLKATF